MLRKTQDILATRVMMSFALSATFLVFILLFVLFLKSRPILVSQPILSLFFSSVWLPLKGQFGLFPFIVGTLEVTAIALIIAVPISILSSIYLAEYSSCRIRGVVRPFIDLLAGIPSVIFGFWGVITVVPVVKSIGRFFGHDTTGYCLLSGGIVLAIMVFPIIISIATEVLCSVKQELRESSLSLGTTRWETTKYVVLKSAHQGIIASIILGFARAFGETIAVLMVIGNSVNIPASVFDPAYTLPGLIANNYGEMMSIPLYDSALLFAAFVLLVVVAMFNFIAHYILLRLRRNSM